MSFQFQITTDNLAWEKCALMQVALRLRALSARVRMRCIHMRYIDVLCVRATCACAHAHMQAMLLFDNLIRQTGATVHIVVCTTVRAA